MKYGQQRLVAGRKIIYFFSVLLTGSSSKDLIYSKLVDDYEEVRNFEEAAQVMLTFEHNLQRKKCQDIHTP